MKKAISHTFECLACIETHGANSQVTTDKYDALIGTPNLNKAEPDTLEARSVGQALSALSVGDDQEEDKHPER